MGHAVCIEHMRQIQKLTMLCILVCLLCLWCSLGAATLKKGVKGGAYESYYCLPLDTKSEMFSTKYRKTWGEYDHLAIRFEESPGNPIAFYHAVSEALGQNTTWQREGFFWVFDAKEPIESIEHRLGKSSCPGEVEMVIPVKQQPIPRENLLLYDALPEEYRNVTGGLSSIGIKIGIKEFWQSSVSWSLVETGLSKNRNNLEIIALLDPHGKPMTKEWSEAYFNNPDDTSGIGLLIRLEGSDLLIDGQFRYMKAHLAVRHDMSPILRLSGLSRSIFTFGGFMCWEGRYIPNYCKNDVIHSIFGYDANTLMVTMRRKTKEIRFIKKPNPREWEDDMEFVGIDAQIKILKKEDELAMLTSRNKWPKASNASILFREYLSPAFLLFESELLRLLLLSLLSVLIIFVAFLKKHAQWRSWLKIMALPAVFFLFVLYKTSQSPIGQRFVKDPLAVLLLLLHVCIFLVSSAAFTSYLINKPATRMKWLKWLAVAIVGSLTVYALKGIMAPLAGLIALCCGLLLLVMSIVFVIQGSEWLLQRWPNWKGMVLSLVNALGCIEITAIALLPLSLGLSGEGGMGIAIVYVYFIFVAVPGTAIYAFVRYKKKDVNSAVEKLV